MARPLPRELKKGDRVGRINAGLYPWHKRWPRGTVVRLDPRCVLPYAVKWDSGVQSNYARWELRFIPPVKPAQNIRYTPGYTKRKHKPHPPRSIAVPTTTTATTTNTQHPRQKVTTEQIEKFLSTGKRAISDVASKFNVTNATARKHVVALADSRKVQKVGSRPQEGGKRGRPADLYSAVRA